MQLPELPVGRLTNDPRVSGLGGRFECPSWLAESRLAFPGSPVRVGVLIMSQAGRGRGGLTRHYRSMSDLSSHRTNHTNISVL